MKLVYMPVLAVLIAFVSVGSCSRYSDVVKQLSLRNEVRKLQQVRAQHVGPPLPGLRQSRDVGTDKIISVHVVPPPPGLRQSRDVGTDKKISVQTVMENHQTLDYYLIKDRDHLRLQRRPPPGK